MNKPLKMLVGTSIALMLSVGYGAAQAQDDTAASAPMAKETHKQKWHADHKLEAQVRHALTTHKVESSDIRIVARHGVVTLDGTVEDASLIPVATSAAQGVAGVKSVKNNLTMHEAGN
ncbi:BON domain-containing protein [Paraburkholderia rhizosphaerae]|uniref:BON domain-containing protein n=1 Tax=Paraburkholderia rhizosphaerae TaxID=480658 RepID=A0A4R8LK65_9BURK|nr:BON domain-containing protein [Paraburkholderia rhizosphaerae]TDY44502.1 BON domain-containing protein [Paraburkholderia rhizosphaerae]